MKNGKALFHHVLELLSCCKKALFIFNLGLPIGKMTVKPSATASRSQLSVGLGVTVGLVAKGRSAWQPGKPLGVSGRVVLASLLPDWKQGRS